jgi:hypothetical protein
MFDIANAVVAALQSGDVPSDPIHTFADLVETPIAFMLDPEVELEDAEKSHLFVVPGNVKQEIGTRDSKRGEWSIDIALRKKFPLASVVPFNSASLALVAPLFQLLEDVDDYLFQLQRLPTMDGPAWLSSALRYAYVMQRFRSEGEYVGILTVTYLHWQ